MSDSSCYLYCHNRKKALKRKQAGWIRPPNNYNEFPGGSLFRQDVKNVVQLNCSVLTKYVLNESVNVLKFFGEKFKRKKIGKCFCWLVAMNFGCTDSFMKELGNNQNYVRNQHSTSVPIKAQVTERRFKLIPIHTSVTY